jgi:hypothetical protein
VILYIVAEAGPIGTRSYRADSLVDDNLERPPSPIARMSNSG